MKKAFSLLIAVAIAVVVCTGCTGAMYDTEATTPATEAPAPATDAPVIETQAPVIETEAPAPAGYFTYTDPYYGWTVQVPEVWHTYGMIVEDNENDADRFMYKDAYLNDNAGHVFTIVNTTSPIDTTQLPHGGELYNDGSLQVYWWAATDVQFGVSYSPDTAEFQRQADEYGQLSETRDEILYSFSF